MGGMGAGTHKSDQTAAAARLPAYPTCPALTSHTHASASHPLLAAGLVGAISFAPITAVFPVEMYIRHKRPSTRVRHGLRTLSALAVLVTLATTAGSLQRLVTSWGDFTLFGNS